MPAIPAASEDEVLAEQAEYVLEHHEDSRFAELRALLMRAFEDRRTKKAAAFSFLAL